MWFCFFWSSQTFYPNWTIFLNGYIRHICDIFQLYLNILISLDRDDTSALKVHLRRLSVHPLVRFCHFSALLSIPPDLTRHVTHSANDQTGGGNIFHIEIISISIHASMIRKLSPQCFHIKVMELPTI